MQEVGYGLKIVRRTSGRVRNLKNASTIIQFFIPYQLNLDPNEIYEMKMPNDNKVYRIQVVSRTSYTLKFNHKLFGLLDDDTNENNSIMLRSGDRFGKTGHSVIQITMNRFECFLNSNDEVDPDKLVSTLEKSCRIFNYFLDRYAAVTIHRQPSKISLYDIHSLDMIYFDEVSLKPYFEVYLSTLHGGTITDKFVSPPPKVNERLKYLLYNPESNSDFLGVNAVRTVFSGDYMNAIVQAVTHLEAYIYKLYYSVFEKKSVKDGEEKLKKLGLTALIQTLPLILDETTYKLMAEKFDLRKLTSVIKIRNAYIHKGKSGSIDTLFAADEMVTFVNDFCVYLANLIGEDHMLDEDKLGWK